MEQNPAIEQLTYSQAIAQLESIVKKMQSQECDIDNLSALTSQSLQLLKHCKAKLTATDEELKNVLAELEKSQQ
ncbi:MAG: exodeoxyribonuclease VII small subunit [Muribaculaceae bacterium]|nr:exodeoxyribonuclease VII small subunit [Muribaculaceae bacterium]